MSYVFDGREIVLPGAYSRMNVDAFNLANGAIIKRLAIIAEAKGGTPRTFSLISGYREAVDIVKGGEGFSLIELAMDGSSDITGPGEVLFYRINAAVAASLAAVGGLGNLTITAKTQHAGLLSNSFQVRRDVPADDANARVLQVRNTGSYDGDIYVSPYLGPALQITYTGGGTPTAAIAASGGQKTLTLTGANAQETHAILIGGSGFTSFGELAAFINGTAAWTAQVLYQHELYDPGLMATGSLSFTDSVTVLNLGVEAQKRWLEDNPLVSAAIVVASESGNGAGWFFLTGGNEGAAVTNQDYQNALNDLGSQDVQAVVVGSTAAAVHAMLDAHCKQYSHGKIMRERIGFCGTALASSAANEITDSLARAKEIASERTVVAFNSVQRRNLITNRLEALSPNKVAAMLAGMYCGVRPEVSLTYRTVKCAGLTYVHSDATLEKAIKGGALPIHYDEQDGVCRVTKGITSHIKDNNTMRRLIIGVSIRDYLNRVIRLAMKPYIGLTGDETTFGFIRQVIEATLEKEVRGPQQPEGVLTVGADGTAYRDINVVPDGREAVFISFTAYPVTEIGYIFVTGYLQPSVLRSAA